MMSSPQRFDLCSVGRQAAQRVGGGDHRVAVAQQLMGHRVPAAGVGERAVDENDGRFAAAVQRGLRGAGADDRDGRRDEQGRRGHRDGSESIGR